MDIRRSRASLSLDQIRRGIARLAGVLKCVTGQSRGESYPKTFRISIAIGS